MKRQHFFFFFWGGVCYCFDVVSLHFDDEIHIDYFLFSIKRERERERVSLLTLRCSPPGKEDGRNWEEGDLNNWP